LILTSESALRGDEWIRVALHSGQHVRATLKGRDSSTDLAVLACETGVTQAAMFAEGEVKVGQIALTVGRLYDTGPIATF